ncbi:MAG: hypothetical protein SFU98_13030 [Leptospiraceae bacterium]|nr:hypothetical protein [Leptospiraceae bacterium]
MSRFEFFIILFLLIHCSSNNARIIDYHNDGKKETYILDYKLLWNFEETCDFEKKSFKCIHYWFPLETSTLYPYIIGVDYSLKDKYIQLIVGSGADGFRAYEKKLSYPSDNPEKDKKLLNTVKWTNDSVEAKTPSIQFLLVENNIDRSIHFWFIHNEKRCPNLRSCTNGMVIFPKERPETIHAYRFGNNQTKLSLSHSDSSFIKRIFKFISLLLS